MSKTIICPLCKREYKKSSVEFTLTKPTADMLNKLTYEERRRIKDHQNWIDACSWCFEKTIGDNTEDEDILDAFHDMTR